MWNGIGWGLEPWWNRRWGHGATFTNPYFVAGSSGFDFSQPIVVQNFVESTADATGGVAEATSQASVENQQAMQLFDDGVAAFQAADFQAALARLDSALKLMPNDPVLHEVRALSLFALGRFQDAAAALNALLASAPGMDWTSMSHLYGDLEDYTRQLRALEAHVKNNPTDAAAMFVLAYHYLVIGETDAAIKELQEVVRLQPRDATAQRMLASLVPPEATTTAKPAETRQTLPATDAPAAAGPNTDLVGSWTASDDDITIALTVDEQSQFTWKTTPKGKPAIELKGDLVASSDTISLDSVEQGSMVGQVKSGGPDKFTFLLRGMPPSDSGLVFTRVK